MAMVSQSPRKDVPARSGYRLLCLLAAGVLALAAGPKQTLAQSVDCNSSTQGTDF